MSVQSTSVAVDALDSFTRCIAAEARSLETSGEPATTIAEVAASKCERLKLPAAELLIAEFRSKPEMQQYEADYPTSAAIIDEMRQRRLKSLDGTARSIALRVVVEARSKRQIAK